MPQTNQGQLKKNESECGTLFSEVKQQGEAAVDALRDVTDDAAAKAKELAKNVAAEFENVPKLIQKYPVQSVLVGVGVGVLAGMFFRRFVD